MIHSDAPKPVGSPYIPQDVDKKVEVAQKASEDAGNYNFVFYDKKGAKGKEKKKPLPEIGAPVEINLSEKAMEKLAPKEDEPEKGKDSGVMEKKDENEKKEPGDGHINITV